MDGCTWCLCNEKMKKYHDEEWGIPLHDDHRQFEFLMMEVMQCGLNWNMMIQKREIFRQCFDGFDYDRIAAYTEEDIERILSWEGMIKSRRKVEAVIHNARCFQKVREERPFSMQAIKREKFRPITPCRSRSARIKETRF